MIYFMMYLIFFFSFSLSLSFPHSHFTPHICFPASCPDASCIDWQELNLDNEPRWKYESEIDRFTSPSVRSIPSFSLLSLVSMATPAQDSADGASQLPSTSSLAAAKTVDTSTSMTPETETTSRYKTPPPSSEKGSNPENDVIVPALSPKENDPHIVAACASLRVVSEHLSFGARSCHYTVELMRNLAQSMTHPVGAFITPVFYVPTHVW
jgi:hypothetical protein